MALARTLAATLAFSSGAFSPLGADALHLTWNDCWQAAGAASDATFDCTSPDGEDRLFVAFTLTSPIDSIIGLEAVIDLQHTSPILPPWWELAPGGCREGSLRASIPPAAQSPCANPWGAVGSALIQSYLVGMPRGGVNQARILAVVTVVPSDSARTLLPGTPYVALRLALDHRLSASGACAGCQGAACLVLNSITFKRLPGGSGDVTISPQTAGVENMATWQGTGADCLAVPVSRGTWGRLKTLYR